MPRPYPADLRQAALRACARGDGTRRRIARRYGVAGSTLHDWLRQERAEGRRRLRPHAGGRPRVIDPEGEAVLRALVGGDGDATLAEYAAALEARTERQASAPMICEALERLGLGREKRRFGPASRTGRMSPGSGRPAGTRWPAPILVDGSGVMTKMTRTRARAPRGARALGSVAHGGWRRVTLLGALGLDGPVAMMSVEAATSAAVFLAFLDRLLLPELARRPGAALVTDNLAPHKAGVVRGRIEGAGLKLRFLPRHSPDLFPIEPSWSKIKALLRAREAGSVEALDRELPEVLNAVSARDARGWFRHCGYPASN